jgi:outer membrane protein TolC
MNPKAYTAILCLFISGQAVPQKIITLGECYNRAESVNALANESRSYASIYELKDRNISKGLLPSLDAGATFNYNSEVIDISQSLGSLPVPGIADAIRPLPHEQYRVTIDINQTLYDGGMVRSARSLEKAELNVNQKQSETDLYKLRSLVNSYYFGILLAGKQQELQQDYIRVIDERLRIMESAFRNGMILRSDLDVLLAEKLKLSQSIKENAIKRASLLRMLSDITGSQLDTSATLVMPPETIDQDILSRPELELFDLKKDQLSASLKVIGSKRMPKAFAFATLGYGNPPGNNFFRDEFAPYYIVGAGVKWNIFDWNRTNNERQVVSYQQELIEGRKKDFEDNIRRLLESKKAEISSIESMIATDTEIIGVRKRITATAASQNENGSITATDYLNELNAERQAMINHEIHKISRALAIAEYNNLIGKKTE